MPHDPSNTAATPSDATMSVCAAALLNAKSAALLTFTDDGGRLVPSFALPMPCGAARMTVTTGDGATVRMPGLALSPLIAAAAIGRPLARIAAHDALDREGLRVHSVTVDRDVDGRPITILGFDDPIQPLARA